MKRTIFLTTLLMSVWMMGATAQPYGPKGCCSNTDNIPNVSEEQKSKIETLRVEHLKKVTAMQAELQKLRAEKHALMGSENPDKKAIDAVIEKMGQQHVAMQKEAANHRLAVRSLLTSEQRVYFDAYSHCKQRGFMGNNAGEKPKGKRGKGYGYRCGGWN